MNKIHIAEFQVYTYEADFKGKAHFYSLLNYLQEAAAQQAALLGFGFKDLIKKKLCWLLSRYHIKVFAYPFLGDKLRVSTWPSGIQGTFALRDYIITGKRDNKLLSATSSWVLWDIEKKEPHPLKNIFSESLIHNKRALKDSFPPLPQLNNPEYEVNFRVMVKDLDLNKHVNNVVYIQWALESVPKDIVLENHPLKVEAAYKAEAFFGEEVISRTQAIETEGRLGYLHQIINKQKGTELTRLRSIWG